MLVSCAISLNTIRPSDVTPEPAPKDTLETETVSKALCQMLVTLSGIARAPESAVNAKPYEPMF